MTRLKDDDTGVALIVTLLILMLMAGLMAGFFAAVNADMRSNALDKDQTRAYAAAHAGLEKLTSDLATLFNGDVSPSVGQISALLQYPPQIPGYEYRAPGGGTNSGYTVTWKADGLGNPAPDDPTGSIITAGPYRGLRGIITKYPITVTARSTSGGAEVRLRRELQTVAVPVFQFGLFSQTDLSFFAGPNFNFGGRIHTNGTLYLAQGDAATLTLSDRVTAAGEVIRWQLSNGWLTGAGSGYTGNISMEVVQGGGACCVGWTMRNLARTEGSLVNGPGTAINEPTWTPLSIGTYKSNLRSGRTGATVLNLPVVSQGATPIDLIRRPATANEDAINAPVFGQRFFSQASLRILLSDRAADISNVNLPTVTGTAPIPLDGWIAGVPAGYGPVDATHPPIARSPGPRAAAVVGPGAPTGNWAAAPPTGVLPVTAAIPAWLKMGVITSPTQVAPLACTGKTSTTLTGCVVTTAIPLGTIISAVVTDGTFVRTYTATTTAAAAIGNPRTITFGAGATDLFWRGTFWVNGTAGSATTPAPSALVTCTGYDTTPSFTGCSFTGSAAPIAGQTITTNALASQDQPLNGGFIKIEKQTSAGVWSDVTLEILNLGYSATNQDGFICPDPNPNAVLRLQRLKDNGRPAAGPVGGAGGYCDYASSLNPYDYWPNALYDAREGDYRDGVPINGAGSAMNAGGVMNYIALDMPNLKRWFAGNIGATGNQAWNQNGYIVYFSDRRGNHWAGAPVVDAETAEYGAEDNINPGSATGLPASGGLPDVGEDVNGNGVLDIYGQTPSACCLGSLIVPVGAAAPLDGATRPWTQFAGTANNPAMAKVNKQILFRRALKLINGGINAGVNNLPTSGLTVASENPVYVQGNYNATTASANVNPNVPAAVLSDAVTLLSNQWTDIESFDSPNDPTLRQATGSASYRMAVAAGKTLSFPRPALGAPPNDFGTDGGVHNFLRYLEDWNGQTLNYNGSIVSLWISRQAIGTYKCCTNVYGPPARAYSFDTNFLLPSLLPPGTPMFRDVNTLTFRQILRPTQ